MDNLISLLILVAQWCPQRFTGDSHQGYISSTEMDACRKKFIKCIDDKKLVYAGVLTEKNKTDLTTCALEAKP